MLLAQHPWTTGYTFTIAGSTSFWSEFPLLESLRFLIYFCLYFLGLLSLLQFFCSLQSQFLRSLNLCSAVSQSNTPCLGPSTPMFADDFSILGFWFSPILVGCSTIWCWVKAPYVFPVLSHFWWTSYICLGFISNFGWFYPLSVGVHPSEVVSLLPIFQQGSELQASREWLSRWAAGRKVDDFALSFRVGARLCLVNALDR